MKSKFQKRNGGESARRRYKSRHRVKAAVQEIKMASSVASHNGRPDDSFTELKALRQPVGGVAGVGRNVTTESKSSSVNIRPIQMRQ